ncbi:hypothetical protein ABZ943_06870 [Streptomyces rubiginosohelvolus]|uniref:hypothetical protein n=1 Tax=Streptomyces rubiginosohelvolus TaxID=67362 RepID=UPI0033E35BD8
MTATPLHWSDTTHEVLSGDLNVAVAYVTPTGGAVVVSVSPLGLTDRAAGRIGFTTSLGFPRKLERILRDPRVALAYHTREHGLARPEDYVLAQGDAVVDTRPSPQRLDDVLDASDRFFGPGKSGRAWDWLLHEYRRARVYVDIDVRRMATWPDLAACGPQEVTGPAWPDAPAEQRAPENGTAPRVDVAKLSRKVDPLPYRLLAYRGADGYPVVVPVEIVGRDHTGFRLLSPPGLLPPGGRRAGLLAHSFRPQNVGLAMMTFTGWLTARSETEACYAPHTSTALAARGTAVLGGLLVSWYTRVSSTGADGLGLPADLLDRASSTLAEALIVTGEVGGGTGSLLLAAAKEAFTEAATVTGIAGAGVMVVAAIWALVTLRGVSANLDLAEEHERQVH